jgi:ankyrin repeat protein
MSATATTLTAFFDAVRTDDIPTVRRLLGEDVSLAKARWAGRAGDGKMRSLGPSPFNQHTWLTVPEACEPDDPRFTSTPLIYTRNDEMVRTLVEAGADVNAKGTSGEIEMPDWFFTPLWRAAHDGRLASVQLLAERGADLNYGTPDGANQALKTAAENDRPEVCKYLLAVGAIPDLITAAMLGLPDQVEILVAARPDAIRQRDEHGRSALDAATLCDTFRGPRTCFHTGHDQAANTLLRHGATMELAHAASLGRMDDVRRMVEDDPGILRRPVEMVALIGGTAIKESPLATAKRRERTELIDYLLKHGAMDQPRVVWQ